MTELKDAILKDIQEQDITPKSRFWFLSGHILLWVMCVVTVFFGACAIAMILFEWFGTDRELMRLVRWKQESGKMIAIFPYIWAGLTVLVVGISAFFFRQTERGYKHNPALIVAGIIVCSGITGGVLFSIKGPHLFDAFFQKHPMYRQMREDIRDTILKPENGVLGGIFIENSTLQNHRGETYEIVFACQEPKCEKFAQEVILRMPVLLGGTLLETSIFEVHTLYPPKKDDIKKILLHPRTRGHMPKLKDIFPRKNDNNQ